MTRYRPAPTMPTNIGDFPLSTPLACRGIAVCIAMRDGIDRPATLPTLASMTSLSERTVRRHLAALLAAGWVRREVSP